MSFVGRDEYLDEFKNELKRDRPSFLILYGRRRVGKTRLIEEAISEEGSVHFQAKQVTEGDNIKRLKKEIRKCFEIENDAVLDDIGEWKSVFQYLEKKAENLENRVTVVLDEFPYICEANDGIPSIIQEIWDRIDHEEKLINIVLCGSQMAFMEDLLSQKNPLHGRQTYKLKLPPLTLFQASDFFPEWNAKDIVLAYSIFGGIPHYLNLCDPNLTLEENILNLVLKPGSSLLEEPTNLLRSELNKIHRYSSLIMAIARGNTEWGKILNQIEDLESEDMGYYMDRLKELHLIRSQASLHVQDPEKRRNKRYYLEDHFFEFWYRFVFPHEEIIRNGDGEALYDDHIKPGLNQFMGGTFEEISQQHVKHTARSFLNSPAREAGKIWTGDFDIDVAGTLLNDEEFYGECKWWTDPVGANVLEDLEVNMEKADYGNKSSRKHRLLFSKAGFTEELREREESDGTLHLLTPEDLV